MRYLNETERKAFIENYLPEWRSDIHTVSLIDYKGVKEYLVNRHYFIIVKNHQVIHKDLQA